MRNRSLSGKLAKGGGGGVGGGEGVEGVEGNQDWISISLIQDEFQSVSHFLS